MTALAVVGYILVGLVTFVCMVTWFAWEDKEAHGEDLIGSAFCALLWPFFLPIGLVAILAINFQEWVVAMAKQHERDKQRKRNQ